MGKDYTPFKMKGFSGFGNSPMTKKSPAKDDPHKTTAEHAAHEVEEKKVVYNKDNPHELTGTVNDAGTRVIDETGEWTGSGDRSDLVRKYGGSAKGSDE